MSWVIGRIGVVVIWFSIVLPGFAEELNLMPEPAHLEQQQGSLSLDRLPRVELAGGDSRVRVAVDRFTQHLAARTGVPFTRPDLQADSTTLLVIRCGGQGLPTQALSEDESYQLVVNTKSIELTAPNPLGIMHGLETLLQLVESGPQGWVIPNVRIEDSPRFAWRGLMIDVSRHFMSIGDLKRNIDGMEYVKLNVLHLHLSDDQGFRVESKRRPRLNEVASGGQFYTQTEVRDLIAYARERGIRVVPEFDVPGHAVSWLVAYPELASSPRVSQLVRSERDQLRPPLDPTQEGTYKLLNDVFGEMARLFPDEYFHIGGDEVDGKYWDGNERIQAWMRAHNIKNNHDLQAHFNKRVQEILSKHGKRMEGWDEILADDLPKDTLVQSWRGPKSLVQASQMGFKTILSAGYYLDLMYPASTHYAVDPWGGESASLTAQQKSLILGGEAAQWTEYVTPEILDNRLWPRLGAIAERLWSPESVTDVDSMYRRLAVLSRNLEWLDLQHRTNSRKMLERIAGDAPPRLIETLAMTVEPVKEYDREKTQKFDVNMPLNHLVDAVPPESSYAREINALAMEAVQNLPQKQGANQEAREELHEWFVEWRDNDARLQPYLATSALRAPLAPLSHSLAVLGTIGLEALDAIESGRPVTAEERKAQLAALEDSSAPHAELMFVITLAVRTLITAEP
jgi:hexosaminidase